jgi:hypothetical protein
VRVIYVKYHAEISRLIAVSPSEYYEYYLYYTSILRIDGIYLGVSYILNPYTFSINRINSRNSTNSLSRRLSYIYFTIISCCLYLL